MKYRVFCRIALTFLFVTLLSFSLLAFPKSERTAEAAGPTIVGGDITTNTIWTAANSPYIVTSNVTVNSGARLTIEPGVSVVFGLDVWLQIEGELIARGTEINPILFTSGQGSPAPGDWAGILFTDTSVDAEYDGYGEYLSGSIIQYCIVEYGWGIEITLSSPFIDHSVIRNNSAFAGGGIFIMGSTVTMSYNNIRNNTADFGGGICAESSSVILRHNTITNNLAAYEGGGLFLYTGTATLNNNEVSNNSCIEFTGGGICAYDSTITLNNNHINSNSSLNSAGGGVYIYQSTASISDNTFKFNSAVWGGGILCDSSLSTVSNNTFTDNLGYNIGGGAYFYGGTAIVSGNTIEHNLAFFGGGVCIDEASANLSYNRITGNSGGSGIHIISSQPLINNNDIYGNLSCDVYNANVEVAAASADENSESQVTGKLDRDVKYGSLERTFPAYKSSDSEPPDEIGEVIAQDGLDVDCTNNWWGTTNEAEIQAHIYDYFDDVELGVVDYTPYRTVPVFTSGSISGYVYEQDGTTPIAGATVALCDHPDPFNLLTSFAIITTTDVTGYYSLPGVFQGEYDGLYAAAPGHIIKWYDDKAGFSTANPINVVSGNNLDIDFLLDTGAGSISGVVNEVWIEDEVENTFPLGFMGVVICDSETGMIVTAAITNEDGTYEIPSLAPGNYKVLASVVDFIHQFHDEKETWSDADLVTITAAQNEEIDFLLTYGGGNIFGHVYKGDGVTPVETEGNAISVMAFDYYTGDIAFGALLNPDGSYMISGLVPGDYKVMASVGGVSEWYEGQDSIVLADLVPVLELTTTPNIDFILDLGTPTVTSLVPDEGIQGSILTAVVINGTSLTGATSITFSGTGVTGTVTEVIDDTQITADVTIAADASLGSRDVVVTTPGGTSVPLVGGFTVVKRGDANGDGVVNMGDVTKVERIILGYDAPTPGADANGDGVINMGDVTTIELIILGFIP